MTRPTSAFASLLAVAMLAVAAPFASAAEPEHLAQARATDDSCPVGSIPSAGLTDVPAANPHHGAIDCVVHWFIAQGVGPQSYGPTRNVTRAQMASFITRLIESAGGTLRVDAPDAFVDDNDNTHEASINKLAGAGVVSGKTAQSFAPGGLVSRAQMATFIARAASFVLGPLPTPEGDYFADDDESTHEANINRVAAAGITTGTSGASYQPNALVRRDQMASFLARALDLLAEGTGTPSGSLDTAQVLTFAKSGTGGTAPYTYTGAKTCPTYAGRPSDAGDDTVADIGDWYLARYCVDGVYRGVLAATADIPALQAAWITINSQIGGCQGIDHVVVGWHDIDADGVVLDGRGAVIATPSCDPLSWDWIEPARFPVYNFSWLQLDFRETALGTPGAFYWRGYVQAVGETGDAIDAVPNAGPEHFIV